MPVFNESVDGARRWPKIITNGDLVLGIAVLVTWATSAAVNGRRPSCLGSIQGSRHRGLMVSNYIDNWDLYVLFLLVYVRFGVFVDNFRFVLSLYNLFIYFKFTVYNVLKYIFVFNLVTVGLYKMSFKDAEK